MSSMCAAQSGYECPRRAAADGLFNEYVFSRDKSVCLSRLSNNGQSND